MPIIGRKDFFMSDYPSLSDEKLAALCRDCDDEKAWNELSLRYLRVAKAVASSFSGSALEGEDLVQEGILGFLAAVWSFNEKNAASFATYASVCIRNRMLSALKTRSAQKQIPNSLFVPIEDESATADSALSPEEAVVSKKEVSRLSALISTKLSPQEKKVFSLYLCNNSYGEIAALTGLSQKAVDGTLQRARKKLRSALE